MISLLVPFVRIHSFSRLAGGRAWRDRARFGFVVELLPRVWLISFRPGVFGQRHPGLNFHVPPVFASLSIVSLSFSGAISSSPRAKENRFLKNEGCDEDRAAVLTMAPCHFAASSAIQCTPGHLLVGRIGLFFLADLSLLFHVGITMPWSFQTSSATQNWCIHVLLTSV